MENKIFVKKQISNTIEQKQTVTHKPVKRTESTPVGKLFDVEKYLKDNFQWRYNLILAKVEFKKEGECEFRQMRDYDYNSILRALINLDISCNMSLLRQILSSDFMETYNPFNEYFFNLPEWNEGMPDYIGQLGESVQTNNQELWLKCFKKWLVALTASAIEEVVVNHCVLILTGGQGLGKTTWLTNLIPKPLKTYIMTGVPNLSDKDSKVQMSECILMNLDELGVLNTTKLNQLKEMVTNGNIRLRKAYGYNIEYYVRRASFCGSANEKQFLTDTTGNRRFLAFDAKSIDYQCDIDLNMVFAQAMYLFKNEFVYHFIKEDIDEINAHTENFRLMSIEEEALVAHFKPASSTDKDAVFMTATEITKFLSRHEKVPMGNSSIQRLGKALQKNGFTRKKVGERYKWNVSPIAKE